MKIWFMDRQGRKISREEHLEKCHDDSYCLLKKVEKDGILLSASWVGVACDLEKEAALFCVEARASKSNGHPKRAKEALSAILPEPLAGPTFWGTEEAALREFHRLEELLFGG